MANANVATPSPSNSVSSGTGMWAATRMVTTSGIAPVLRGIAVTLWFKVQPISVDRTMLDIVALVPPDFADDGAELLVGVAEINDEDVRINVRTQHGLRSRFASPGPVHELERGCWQFRQWLASMTSSRIASLSQACSRAGTLLAL